MAVLRFAGTNSHGSRFAYLQRRWRPRARLRLSFEAYFLPAGAVPEMVQLLGSTSPKARNLAAQTLAKLIAAYPDARSGHHSVLCCRRGHMRGLQRRSLLPPHRRG